MRTRRALLILAVVVAALIGLANLIRERLDVAPAVDGDNIIFRRAYTLAGTVEDNLVVWAQTIDLLSDSTVEGDVALVGETVAVDGAINGNLTVMGSAITLGDNGSIDGNARLMGSTVTLEGEVNGRLVVAGDRLTLGSNAAIDGELYACVEAISGQREGLAVLPCGDADGGLPQSILQNVPTPDLLLTETKPTGDLLVVGLLSAAFSAVALAGLGTLAVTIFPRQISHLEEAIRLQTRSLVLTGLMCFLLVIGLGSGSIVLLALAPPIGVLLLPVLALLGLALLGMLVAGTVTLTIVLGDWLLARVSRGTWPPLVAAAVGSLALSLVLHALLILPFGAVVTLIIVAILSSVALGAAINTRMGTRPLRQQYFVQG